MRLYCRETKCIPTMNKLILAATFTLITTAAFSQTPDYVEPYTWDQVYAQKVSPNGLYVMGQDEVANTYLLETGVNRINRYSSVYPGDGNCVSNSGVVVGQGVTTSKAVIMKNGTIQTPNSIKSYPLSSFNGITPDGSRICGYVSNPNGYPLDIPVYCDVNSDGSIGAPVVLPYPKKSFFGSSPQWVVAFCISDDGKTISGLVTDNSGMYTWPIIFSQDEEGEWTYSQPTEADFNLDGNTLPPDLDGQEPIQPDAADYMTKEEYNEWLKALEEDPYTPADEFMTEEEKLAWEEAIDNYNLEYDLFLEKLDEYWKQMNILGKNQMYGGYMALSPDGKIMVTDRLGFADDEPNTVADYFYPAIFNTVESTYSLLDTKVKNLLTTQVFDDGTILALSAPSDFMPYTSYIRLAGEEEFILFTDFLEQNIPQYYPWLEDTLGQTGIIGYEDGEPVNGFYIITGYISTSRDFTTISGGLPIGGFFSYVYHDSNTSMGIDEISAENAREGIYVVYNINGIKVMETTEKSALNSLPRGIYIINGKKIAI